MNSDFSSLNASPSSSPSLRMHAKFQGQERHELVNAARKLRRLKRQMFLKHVGEAPQSPVDTLRTKIMELGLAENEPILPFRPRSASMDMSSLSFDAYASNQSLGTVEE